MLMFVLFVIVGLLPMAAPAQAEERIILAQAPSAPETEEQRKKRLEEERKRRQQQPQQKPQQPQPPQAQPPQRPQPPTAQPPQPPRQEQRPTQQVAPPPQRREVQEPRPTPSVQPQQQLPSQQQPRIGQPPEQRRDPRDPRQQLERAQQPATSPGAAPPRRDGQPPQLQPRIGQPPDERRDPPRQLERPQPGVPSRPERALQPPTSPGASPERAQQPPTPSTPSATPPQQQAQPPRPEIQPGGRQQLERAQQPPTPTPGTPTVAPPPSQEVGQDKRRIEELRKERRERVEGDRKLIEEPDRRVIIRERDRVIIRHDETERFRRLGRDLHVERGRSGERVTVFRRPDGVEIVSVVDDHGRLLRRYRRWPDGREVVLIENTPRFHDHRVVVVNVAPPRIVIPREHYIVESERASREELYETLAAPPVEHVDRRYTLDEIRYNYNLRARMRQVDVDTINFEFGSWEVTPDQVPRLEKIAFAINEVIRRNPDEVLLIEGHTDAVGSEEDNLSLSDRRAETVAALLTEYYQVPPENLTTQGYGEQHLKVPTEAPERRNRRVTVRRITPLLASGR